MIKWYCSDICVSACQADDHFVIIIFLHWLIRCSQGSYRPLYLTLCHSTQYTTHHTNPVTTLAINTKISFSLSRVGNRIILLLIQIIFILSNFSILLDVLLNIFSLYLNPYCNENTNKILFDAENFHIKFISKKCISLKNTFFQHWKLDSVMSIIKETI